MKNITVLFFLIAPFQFLVAQETIRIKGKFRSLPTQCGPSNKTNYDDLFSAAAAPSTNDLIGFLKSDDYSVRYRAAQRLGERGDKSAVVALIETLKDASTAVRETSATALGRLGDNRAVPAIIEVLQKDADRYCRAEAAKALGKIGDQSAVPALMHALKDSNASFGDKLGQGRETSVREFAARALGELKDARAIRALVYEATDDEDSYFVSESLRALVKIGDPEAVLQIFTKRSDVALGIQSPSDLNSKVKSVRLILVEYDVRAGRLVRDPEAKNLEPKNVEGNWLKIKRGSEKAEVYELIGRSDEGSPVVPTTLKPNDFYFWSYTLPRTEAELKAAPHEGYEIRIGWKNGRVDKVERILVQLGSGPATGQISEDKTAQRLGK